jgi:hypothetical protein
MKKTIQGASLPTFVRSGLFAVTIMVMTLGMTGCASWCPPKSDTRGEVRIAPQPRHPPDVADCVCTLEHRVNLCVTVNGSGSLPDSLSFLREREDGSRDSLDRALEYHPRCFGEWRGVQRVLMLREGAIVDSTGWFEIQTVDCCHGEAKTVDFVIGRTP